jgi:NADH-quinone oxidoreductase subunit M
MTKMGIYGVLRLVLPVVPDGVLFWQNTVIVLALIGGIYASIIAFRQDNLKRLTAFSSMAHISMIIAGLFALNVYALQGAMVLVFSHGMVIAALFYIVEQLKNKTGSQLFAAMGGLRNQIPNFAILMLLVVIASIALPLTSNFAGEFLVIAGLFRYSVWLAALAGLAMILGAVYMLYAYQQAMLGESQVSQSLNDAGFTDYLVLVPVILIVFITGIFPQIIFNVVNSGFTSLLVH